MSSTSPQHADTMDQCFRVYLEQLRMLDNSGYKITSTFIHSPPSSVKDAPASKRVHSAPPSLEVLDIRTLPDGEGWGPVLPHPQYEPQPTPVMVAGVWRWEGKLACTSSCASKVADLVMKECQFLRIQEYCVLPEIRRKGMRLNSNWTVRFYVHGLPVQQRAKWLQPLLATVASMLRRHCCDIQVQRCELIVSLEKDQEAICIDFTGSLG